MPDPRHHHSVVTNPIMPLPYHAVMIPRMSPPPTVWLDYVDPACWLVEWRIRRWPSPATGSEPDSPAPPVRRRPFEVLPPGRSVLDPDEPGWRSYLHRMREEAARLGAPLRSPSTVPWTRKAHELALLAEEEGVFLPVHTALFRAYWDEGRDIGRVDVLVEIGHAAGMDRTGVKAALDVDRFAGEVADLRVEAERRGVRGVPTLLAGERILEGYPPEGEMESFLQR